MQCHCFSLSSPLTSTILLPKPKSNHPISLSLQTPHSNCSTKNPISHVSLFNPLRLSVNQQNLMGNKQMSNRKSSVVVCYSSSALLSPSSLHWVSAVAAGILMLVRGTAINRSFLVPLFALQAPATIISWMQGEYGAWSALLALLIRLFYAIPGQLELPFMTLVLVLVAPHQAMNLRGTQAGVIVSLAIAAYLAFQHFTRAGSLQRTFNQDSIVATLAIICITIVPCLLLI